LRYPLNGQLVCRLHGGATPNAQKIAVQRVALAEVNTLASRMVDYDPEYDETPADGLMREVRWSAQVALALGDIVNSMTDDTLVSYSPAQGQRLSAMVEMWERERMNHARLCKLALDAGIQQRQLDIIESQATQIVHAMIALLTSPRLALSAEQIIEGRVVAAEILRVPPPSSE
jgi:hypothetical protein